MTSPVEPTATKPVDQSQPRDENRYHNYTGNRIPWYVRFIWICFWVFAIYYAISYFLPELRTEIVDLP